MFLVPLLALQIDLIDDTRHLCSPLRTDWIKAMLLRFFFWGGGGGGGGGREGGKQAIKFTSARNRGQVCLF